MSEPTPNPETTGKAEEAGASQPLAETVRPSHVVGVGGLEALERLFGNLPAESGSAFVVVQHLSPDFKSLMSELLSRYTEMPISRAENGMQVEPNSVYLIPPKSTMIISGGRLLLTDSDPEAGVKLPSDIFLRSLAQDQEERSIAVILEESAPAGQVAAAQTAAPEEFRLDEGSADRILQLERELQHSREQLQATIEFAHVASHDLQEPLRALSFFSQSLTEDLADVELPDTVRQDLEHIRDASEQMHTLVEDFLALSRAGRSGMHPRWISLRDCVDAALQNVAARLDESEAQVEVAKLPQVFADSTLITQLFQNLIGNALKFHGESPPRIRVTCQQEGPDWVVGVCDNGIGINSEFHTTIFDPFRRLHSRSKFKGSGIGLSICRKAVERHGGRIWVESTLGEGSHFKFQLSGQEANSRSKSQPDDLSGTE